MPSVGLTGRSGVTRSIVIGSRNVPTPSNAALLSRIVTGDEMYFPLGITARVSSIV